MRDFPVPRQPIKVLRDGENSKVIVSSLKILAPLMEIAEMYSDGAAGASSKTLRPDPDINACVIEIADGSDNLTHEARSGFPKYWQIIVRSSPL